MIKNTFRKSNSNVFTNSTVRRLVTAFIMVMSFLCVIGEKCAVHADYLYKPVDAHITFICQGIEGIDGGQYRISIKSETGLEPLPSQEIITVSEDGKGEFILHITEPGTYDYQVYQIKGSDTEVLYDETKYDVHVFVLSDENGKLEYSVAVNVSNTDQKPDIVEFKNIAANTTTETTTEATTVPPTNTSAQSAKTGDETAVGFLVLMLIIASIGIIILLHKRSNRFN